VSFGNTIVSLVFNIQRGRNEIIVFTEARVVKTTEAAASVASNVASALPFLFVFFLLPFLCVLPSLLFLLLSLTFQNIGPAPS